MTEKIINPYTDVPFADLPIDPPGTRFGSQSLNDVSEMQIGSKKNVFRADQNGIWLGRSTFEEAKSATFSVDMDGNIVASSLRRRDFQWFTFFESMDGYSFSFYDPGTSDRGGVTIQQNGILLDTGITTDKRTVVEKSSGNASTFFSWGKSRSFKTIITLTEATSNQFAFIGTGDPGGVSAIVEHFGFYIAGNALYAHQADGATNAYELLQTISSGTVYALEATFIPGSGVTYSVNNVVKTTLSSNYPTPSGSVPYSYFSAYIQNATALRKKMLITMFDFWQAN